MAGFNDSLSINGNNYSRVKTVIELSGLALFSPVDISEYVQGITYTETQDKEFGYVLGSNRPAHFGAGFITSEGTLTLTDAGLNKLNELATQKALPNYMYLGQAGSLNITVSYTTYNDKIKTDVLEHVHFTSYENGVNTDDLIYSREVPMMIGKINNGLIG